MTALRSVADPFERGPGVARLQPALNVAERRQIELDGLQQLHDAGDVFLQSGGYGEADAYGDGRSNAAEFRAGGDPDADDVPLLRFELQSATSDVVLRRLTLRASGSGDDAVDVERVTLWLDAAGDGVVDAATVASAPAVTRRTTVP